MKYGDAPRGPIMPGWVDPENPQVQVQRCHYCDCYHRDEDGCRDILGEMRGEEDEQEIDCKDDCRECEGCRYE